MAYINRKLEFYEVAYDLPSDQLMIWARQNKISLEISHNSVGTDKDISDKLKNKGR